MAPPGGFWVLFDTKKYQVKFLIEVIYHSAIRCSNRAKNTSKKSRPPINQSL